MVGSVPFLTSVGLHGGQGLALAIPDVTPPTVVSFSPLDNATGVSVSTNMVATMSEVVVLGAAGVISLKKTSDNSVIQTWNVATQAGTGAGQVSVVGGTGLTMRLTSALAATTEYYVIWDAGVVKDTSSNNVAALSVTTTWSFTTGAAADTTAPTVSSFSPLDDATSVSVSTDLVATMSETVTLGASGVITLKKTSDNSTIDSWNVATAGGSTAGKVEVVSSTQLTMHLTTSLANSIEYYVIWDAGVVKDAANNPVAALSSTTTWSFTTVAGGFTGLIDVLGVSATRAYSTRKLRSAYAGSAIRIRRSSDNAEQDIGFVGEDLDTAAVTTFVGANSAYVVKMYDQSGGAFDVSHATVTNQPRIVNAGALDVRNNKAAPYFDGTDDFLAAASAAWTVQSAGVVAAADAASPFPHAVGAFGGSASMIFVGQNAAVGYYFSANVGGPNVNNSGLATLPFNGILHEVRATSATGIAGTTEVVQIGKDRGVASAVWVGWIGEAVAFATQLSAPNYATLYDNQKNYWMPLLLDTLGVTATRAYSTRKLRAAYAGSAIRIRRSSDNAEQDIGFSGEDLDTAAISTFVGANSAFVVMMYDQSGGNSNITQATVATQPRIMNAGVLDVRNGKAASYFNANVLTAPSATWTGRTAGALTAYDGATYVRGGGVLSTPTLYPIIVQASAPGYYTGGQMGTPIINSSGNFGVYNGVAHVVRVTTVTAMTPTDIMYVGYDRNASQNWLGWIGEVTIFDIQLSAPNFQTLYDNMKAYWGTS